VAGCDHAAKGFAVQTQRLNFTPAHPVLLHGKENPQNQRGITEFITTEKFSSKRFYFNSYS
jgi:hypothetical protein